MEGASTAGGMMARANAALNAGCDMVLLCNDPRAQDTLLEGLERRPVAPTLAKRLERMRGKAISTAALKANAAYLAATENLARIRVVSVAPHELAHAAEEIGAQRDARGRCARRRASSPPRRSRSPSSLILSRCFSSRPA